MKNREKVLLILTLFCSCLHAREGHEESPHYEWIAGEAVAVCEDGVYISSVKGMTRLNVVEYDRVNDRYRVLCSCLEKPYLYPFEALAVPYSK